MVSLRTFTPLHGWVSRRTRSFSCPTRPAQAELTNNAHNRTSRRRAVNCQPSNVKHSVAGTLPVSRNVIYSFCHRYVTCRKVRCTTTKNAHCHRHVACQPKPATTNCLSKHPTPTRVDERVAHIYTLVWLGCRLPYPSFPCRTKRRTQWKNLTQILNMPRAVAPNAVTNQSTAVTAMIVKTVITTCTTTTHFGMTKMIPKNAATATVTAGICGVHLAATICSKTPKGWLSPGRCPANRLNIPPNDRRG